MIKEVPMSPDDLFIDLGSGKYYLCNATVVSIFSFYVKVIKQALTSQIWRHAVLF